MRNVKIIIWPAVIVCLLAVVNVVSADYVNRVYWTKFAPSDDGVLRANADGSGIEQIVSATFNSLDGLAIDPVENKLYVGTSYHLLRCNLDGSGLETVISGGKAFDFYDLEIDASNRRIYWSDWIQGGPTPGIRRANLDGTSIETVFEGTISHGKAIDAAAGKFYWTAGSIYRSDLDGSNRVTVLANTFGRGHLDGLALDVQSNKMYFTTWEQGGIWRANMDGTDVEYLSDDKTTSIAVDSDGGKLYWTSWAYGADEIRRANLDGSDEEVVCSMGGSGNDIALEIIPEPEPMVYYVDGDANGANDGSSWADAFNYLQDALAVATSSDEIWVAEGIYRPDEDNAHPSGTGDRTATFQLINGVAIKGGYAGFGEPDPNLRDVSNNETVLSGDLNGNDGLNFANNGENSFHVVTGSGADNTAVLDGFTVTAGNANGSYPYSAGAGMFNNEGSPALVNCVFSRNSARVGGGMRNYESSPALTNCTFSNNQGGGMNNTFSSPTLANCTFTGNNGGGMYNDASSPTLTNCTFSENWVSNWGGGMANDMDSKPILTDCKFKGNSAERQGGGMANLLGASPTLFNCSFSRNSAIEQGGAIYGMSESNPIIINCTFSGNSADFGGAMYNFSWFSWSTLTLSNCTVTGNRATSGNALACDSYNQNYPNTINIRNSILWNGGNEIWNNDGSTITISYSDIQGGWPGLGNIDADPCFVLPGYWGDANDPNIHVEPNDPNAVWIEGDYHLLPNSLCIDVGDPNYAAEPNETDLDGNPRVFGGRIDMGAYESMFINVAPVACIVGGDRVVEAEGDCEVRVLLDGSCSSDEDSTEGTNDDINDFDWYEVIDACEPNSDIYLGSGEVIECNLGLGEHLIILEVTDKAGAFDSNEVVITVEDRSAPVITLNGADTIVLECGVDNYIEEGATAHDNCDDDVPVIIGGDTVDTSTCGTYIVTYDATDDSGNATVQVTRMVTVNDTTGPVIALNGLETVILECGTGSYVEQGATATDNCDDDVAVIIGGDVVDTSVCGTYVVTYDASDSWGNEAEQVLRTVIVEDTLPPELSLFVEPSVLWPANHRMVRIEVSWEVSDDCDEDVEVSLVGVTSSEEEDGRGDGRTKNDIVIADDGSIYLRAERTGSGAGRVYTITYEAVDDSGNIAQASATVTVPHKRGPRRLGRGLVWRLRRQVYRRKVQRRGATK